MVRGLSGIWLILIKTTIWSVLSDLPKLDAILTQE
jgi:hypothetical protein